MQRNEIIEAINQKTFETKKLINEINDLKKLLSNYDNQHKINFTSEEKIKLFMDYFKGRDSIYLYLSIDEKNPIYSELDRNSVLLVLDNNIVMRSRRKEESMLKDNTIQDKWKNLNYLERQVLTTIFDKGEITSDETSKIINRSKTTEVKMLNKLIDMNLIEWTGTSKSDTQGRYIIKKY